MKGPNRPIITKNGIEPDICIAHFEKHHNPLSTNEEQKAPENDDELQLK